MNGEPIVENERESHGKREALESTSCTTYLQCQKQDSEIRPPRKLLVTSSPKSLPQIGNSALASFGELQDGGNHPIQLTVINQTNNLPLKRYRTNTCCYKRTLSTIQTSSDFTSTMWSNARVAPFPASPPPSHLPP